MTHNPYKEGYMQALTDVSERIMKLHGGSDHWEDALWEVRENIDDLRYNAEQDTIEL